MEKYRAEWDLISSLWWTETLGYSPKSGQLYWNTPLVFTLFQLISVLTIFKPFLWHLNISHQLAFPNVVCNFFFFCAEETNTDSITYSVGFFLFQIPIKHCLLQNKIDGNVWRWNQLFFAGLSDYILVAVNVKSKSNLHFSKPKINFSKINSLHTKRDISLLQVTDLIETSRTMPCGPGVLTNRQPNIQNPSDMASYLRLKTQACQVTWIMWLKLSHF